MARFRKEIIKIGPYADPVLGRGEITPAQLASIRRSWHPGIPVRMADSQNKPGDKVGTVESLERVGDSVVAIIDVDPETTRGIQQRTILGAAAVIDPLACNSLHSVLITNRPPAASDGYLAATYDAGEQLLALTAGEAPFVSIMQPYPSPTRPPGSRTLTGTGTTTTTSTTARCTCARGRRPV